jgi:hypothetical protein
MDYVTACEHLGLSNNAEFKEQAIKRAYHKNALQYHPDKNTSADADERFKNIHNAYEYLMRHHGYLDEEEDELDPANDYAEEAKDSMFPNPFAEYTSLLYSFLHPILETDSFQDVKSKLVETLLDNIVNKCEEKAFRMIENLSRTQYGKIRELLRGNSETFHIPREFLEKMDHTYQQKFGSEECIKLHPTMDDLFNDNVYKLVEGENTFYVPLWHHELVYDCSGRELYVHCVPNLPDNIEIDDKNDIHVHMRYTLQDIWRLDMIPIQLGCKTLRFPRNQLKMEKSQFIKLPNMGISRIHPSNMYDVSKKGHLFVHIEIATEE